MNILVCVKLVPATTQVEIDGQFRLKRDGVSLELNVADLSAVEAALRLRGQDDTVTVITMGPPKGEAALKELLPRGADRAILLTDPKLGGADTRATALALAAAARRAGPFDLILCGRKAIDGETGQLPGELAAALGFPSVTNCESVERAGEGLLLRRRLESGIAVLTVERPAVVTMCEYVCPLRLPSIKGMRQARGKEVEKHTAADLGLPPEHCGLKGSVTRVVKTDSKFPGLRKGPKETDLKAGAQRIRELVEAVR